MSSFKHRPAKLKYRSDISTLDEFHKDLMKKMNSNYDKLEYRTKIGNLLVNYYDQMTKDQYNQNVEFKKLVISGSFSIDEMSIICFAFSNKYDTG